jgi:peptidoglycan hydrolase-like protein with peptidoglycan-binding domain
MRRIDSIVACAALVGLAACGTSSGDRAASGGAMGAGTGAVIGAVAGAGVGAIPGALIGGGVGAGTGAATKPDQVNLGQPVWREGGAQEAQSTPASGLSHDRITQLQVALNQDGFDPGQADGVFGPKTRAAVQQFQTSRGLPATGQPDQQTLSALRV